MEPRLVRQRLSMQPVDETARLMAPDVLGENDFPFLFHGFGGKARLEDHGSHTADHVVEILGQTFDPVVRKGESRTRAGFDAAGEQWAQLGR